jgi:hypothetical protein
VEVERARKEVREVSSSGTVQAEDGTGGSTQTVGVEAEAAAQCDGAEQGKGKQQNVLPELGGGA